MVTASRAVTGYRVAAQVVADAALGCIADFSCQSTCNMLWSLATGGSRWRAALLDALACRLHALMDGASAQQMGGSASCEASAHLSLFQSVSLLICTPPSTSAHHHCSPTCVVTRAWQDATAASTL